MSPWNSPDLLVGAQRRTNNLHPPPKVSLCVHWNSLCGFRTRAEAVRGRGFPGCGGRREGCGAEGTCLGLSCWGSAAEAAGASRMHCISVNKQEAHDQGTRRGSLKGLFYKVTLTQYLRKGLSDKMLF